MELATPFALIYCPIETPKNKLLEKRAEGPRQASTWLAGVEAGIPSTRLVHVLGGTSEPGKAKTGEISISGTHNRSPAPS
jgi:hypothetical protein